MSQRPFCRNWQILGVSRVGGGEAPKPENNSTNSVSRGARAGSGIFYRPQGHVTEAPPAATRGQGRCVTSVHTGTQDGCAVVEVTFLRGCESEPAAPGRPAPAAGVSLTAVHLVPGQGKCPCPWSPCGVPATPPGPRRSAGRRPARPPSWPRRARAPSRSAAPPQSSFSGPFSLHRGAKF